MKSVILFVFALLCIAKFGYAQGKITSLDAVKADETKPVFSQKVVEDSLCSSFLIVIKDKVKLHKHQAHSENVYVLEGEGVMQLGDSSYTVKKGDHIFIPKNTPHALQVKPGVTVKVLSVQSPRFDGSDRIWLE